MNTDDPHFPGDRIAKILSRAGVASRRDAERMISEGRVKVNGRPITSPALNVGPEDKISVDGTEIGPPEPVRLWLFHKPAGVITTARDEAGRPTVFDQLPEGMPYVMPVGRLDLNSEGLLLLTNDGEVKRRLELPTTGWLRRYRVRINGEGNESLLAALRAGVTIDGVTYQPMEAQFDRQQGANAWLTVGLREGKNREIRRVMEHLGVQVNRLIRLSYGPFALGELEPGAVQEMKAKVLRETLGMDLGDEGGKRGRKPLLSAPALTSVEVRARAAGKISEAASERPSRRAAGQDGRPDVGPDGGRTSDTRPERGPEDASGRRQDGDRTARKFSSRPEGDKPFRREGDRPRRGPGDSGQAERRPWSPRPESEGRAPRKSFGPRSPEGERKARAYARSPEGEGDRPRRGPGDRTQARPGPRPDRSEWTDRKAQGDRPQSPRPDRKAEGDRPYRKPEGERGDRPFRKPDDRGGRPYQKAEGDRPYRKPEGERGDRPYRKPDDRGGRPYQKAEGDRPFRKPDGDRPYRGAERGDAAPSGSPRPYRKPEGERGDRPYRKPEGRPGDTGPRDGAPGRKPFAPRDGAPRAGGPGKSFGKPPFKGTGKTAGRGPGSGPRPGGPRKGPPRKG